MQHTLISLAAGWRHIHGTKLTRRGRGLLLAGAWLFLYQVAPAAQAPVPLGAATSFGVLAATTVTSTGGTLVNGDLGVSPGTAVTGSPGVTGTLHLNDAAAVQAQAALAIAYNDAAGRTTGSILVAGNLGGQTLGPGLYTSISSLEISAGNLTLAGDANAVWIFQMGSTLTTTAGRRVLLSGGAQAANIFWQVGSSATIGANSVLHGNILAAASITMGAGATLDGRALARAGAVTLDANTITVPPVNVAGTVVAWGNNESGQTNVPAGLGLVTAITAGRAFTVAVKSDGTVAAWGDNSRSQTTIPFGLDAVKAVAAGEYHAAALKRDGTVVAWGTYWNGLTYFPVAAPAGMTGVTAVAAGQGHTVVLKNDSTVLAWGRNDEGQTNVPPGLSGVMAIAAGQWHTLALRSNGTVVAWGATIYFGQATVPVGLNNVIAIAGGSSHSLALKSDGTVVGWGNNLLGQAAPPPGLSGVVAISAGQYHSLALKSDGTVVAWGLGDDGQTAIPAAAIGVTAIASGWYHNAALLGPIITAQPVEQTFTLGGSVLLTVTAIGTGLSYQWQFEGANIPGATGPTLNLADLSLVNAGSYRVVVNSTAGGSVTSQATVLSPLYFGGLKFYAGITLAGTVGQQFRVDYADVVTPGQTNWLVLTNLTLPASPFLVIDPNSPGQTQRFYRAVPVL